MSINTKSSYHTAQITTVLGSEIDPQSRRFSLIIEHKIINCEFLQWAKLKLPYYLIVVLVEFIDTNTFNVSY